MVIFNCLVVAKNEQEAHGILSKFRHKYNKYALIREVIVKKNKQHISVIVNEDGWNELENFSEFGFSVPINCPCFNHALEKNANDNSFLVEFFYEHNF